MEQKKQESKPSATSLESRKNQSLFTWIVTASQQPSVTSYEDKKIKEILAYIFVLIGLKNEAIPPDIEQVILVNHIRSSMGKFSLDEFKVAFTLLIEGQLDIDPKHYQNFSPLYLEQVMQAYSRYRFRYLDEHKKLTAEIQEQKPSPTEMMALKIQHIISSFDRYKSGKIVIDFNGEAYKYLEAAGLISLSREQKQEIYEAAKILIQASESEKTLFQKAIKNPETISKDKLIKDKARHLALLRYFKQLRAQNINIEDLLQDPPKK